MNKLLVHVVLILVSQVWFAPGTGPQKEIIDEITNAKTSIYVQAYNFTDPLIGDALVAAEKRGVKVSVIQDAKELNQANNQLQKCQAAGVSCYLDASHPIAHNKIMIFDDDHVLMGSYNFSRQAMKNGENLFRINDPAVVKQYHENWKKHLMESKTMELK